MAILRPLRPVRVDMSALSDAGKMQTRLTDPINVATALSELGIGLLRSYRDSPTDARKNIIEASFSQSARLLMGVARSKEYPKRTKTQALISAVEQGFNADEAQIRFIREAASQKP